MAVIVQEGFDLYNAAPGIRITNRAGIITNGAAGNFQPTAGRFSGSALSIVSINASFAIPTTSLISRATIGVAFRRNSSTVGSAVATFFNGTTPAINAFTNPSGYVVVVRGDFGMNSAANIIATSSTLPIQSDVWAYFECEVYRHPTAGEVRVYVDGVKVIDVANVNTGAVDFNAYGCDGRRSTIDGNMNGAWDDLYVVNTSTRLGPCRIETLSPNADVTKEWTPNSGANNFSRVAEQPTDGDTTYVSTNVDSATDGYRYAPLANNPTKIHAVAARLVGRIDDATPRLLRSVSLRDGYNDFGPQVEMTDSYRVTSAIMNTQIGSSAAWTKAQVNSVVSGPQMTAI